MNTIAYRYGKALRANRRLTATIYALIIGSAPEYRRTELARSTWILLGGTG